MGKEAEQARGKGRVGLRAKREGESFLNYFSFSFISKPFSNLLKCKFELF
jgi:hypothetical protein